MMSCPYKTVLTVKYLIFVRPLKNELVHCVVQWVMGCPCFVLQKDSRTVEDYMIGAESEMYTLKLYVVVTTIETS